jgi:signal transduction histidine kinase
MSLMMSLRWSVAAAVAGVSTAAAIAVGLAAHQLADGILIGRLIAIELAVISLALLASVLVGGWLTRTLQVAAGAARKINEGDLDAVIGAAAGRTRPAEVADLSQALDTLATEVRARRAAEQRFTSDVAHELRTPLTGLVTAAELLPPGRPTELVRDRVQRLRALVEDLLEISRLDARVETADLRPYQLADIVRRIVAEAMPHARLEVHGDVRVLTDFRRLDRVLTNLLANASRHGRPPIVVTVDGAVVTVRDHGRGFPADLLAHGPRRFRTARRERGADHGLGLTIAAGQCRVVGIELRFANHEGGGALGIVDLAARHLR